MQTFISDTLDDILKTRTSFQDVVIILPSQRAKVFLKQELKDKIGLGFLPKIVSIEEFIADISGFHQIDNIQLLFEFYSIYKKLENDAIPFDKFCSWATTVLQDFNEIDQHLIDTKDIFIYIRDIERLKKWSVKGTFKETDLIKDHHSFLEKLNLYYQEFYQYLKAKKFGYQGVLYREACHQIEDYLSLNSSSFFYFIGFNALNKAEELIFQRTLENGTADIYWDIDQNFIESNHLAGKFIKKYKSDWKFYEKNQLKLISNYFSNPKNINVIGAAKNVTQIKYVGEVLESVKDFKNTALILADETLLPITLSSLPNNVESINITMGYPLGDIPVSSLFNAIFQLFLTQEKLQKRVQNLFYYKDVTQFLKQPFIYGLIPNVDEITTDIAKNNISFISYKTLQEYFKNSTDDVKNIILSIFREYTTIDEFLERILNLITILKDDASALDKEYLFRFFTIFNQLKTYQKEYAYFSDIKVLAQFFKQILTQENLSFQGEPLKGLQLMGMLETRVLDFENVILVSANEGVLPANFQKNSFIPFDVKVQFGLPTYREKDAIFSYHFFRLLQRAKNVFILYNTENDSFVSGEKSRFVTQLEMMKPDISERFVNPEVVTEKIEQKEVFKDEAIIKRFQKIAKDGFSPSSLTNYLRNPIVFYKQKILKIKEFDEVEETVAANTLGTVVHEVLDELYTPLVGKILTVDDIKKMKTNALSLVEKQFKIHFKNGDVSTGKNRLIFEVAHRYIQNFLKMERSLVSNENNTLKIVATEEDLSTEIRVDGLDFPIKIHGKVDRVDELNGELRIIDYKTGMVNSSQLRVVDFENLREEKYHKAIQVLLYTFLYSKTKKHDFSQPLKAGIYSFKNLNSQFLGVNFSSNYRKADFEITEERLQEFIIEIKEFIQEIFNPEITFLEPVGAKY